MIPKKLTYIKDRTLLVEHLCELKDEDRRLRFGGIVTDDYIKSYVEKSCKDKTSQWFVCVKDKKIVAACHTAIYNKEAELGCSVSENYRGHGLAQLMFDRAVTYIRTHGITTVYMHCLSENQTMRHIARKNSMTVVSCYGETDAHVEVSPPTPMTAMKDAYLDRVALYDMLFRTNAEMYETFLENFRYDKGIYTTRSS